MIVVRPATLTDIPAIHRLANLTWWPTYSGLISDAQISFMLEQMYTEEALEKQWNEMSFLLAERENEAVGFAAYSLTDAETHLFKLRKLYVLPTEQGKGTGKFLIGQVVQCARELGGQTLELNVQRDNQKARDFYERLGFTIYRELDIPFHHFVLNDYEMRKAL